MAGKSTDEKSTLPVIQLPVELRLRLDRQVDHRKLHGEEGPTLAAIVREYIRRGLAEDEKNQNLAAGERSIPT